jgi:hypothetical protein
MLLLPLASLTAQLERHQMRSSSSASNTSNSSSKGATDSSQPRAGGLINIGLLLQPASVAAAADNPTLRQQQASPLMLAAAPTPAASNQPHKARHKKQHASSSTQQQQPQQQQESCQLMTSASSCAQHPSQQQCKCQQQQQQEGTSGNPIATFLGCAAQAKLLVAGAASAIVSRTAMAPLERVKMDLLLKTSNRSAVDTAVWVWQREGLAGFWKGNGLNLLRTAPFKVREGTGLRRVVQTTVLGVYLHPLVPLPPTMHRHHAVPHCCEHNLAHPSMFSAPQCHYTSSPEHILPPPQTHVDTPSTAAAVSAHKHMQALNFFSFDVYSKALAGVMGDGNNSGRFLAGAMAGVWAGRHVVRVGGLVCMCSGSCAPSAHQAMCMPQDCCCCWCCTITA